MVQMGFAVAKHVQGPTMAAWQCGTSRDAVEVLYQARQMSTTVDVVTNILPQRHSATSLCRRVGDE